MIGLACSAQRTTLSAATSSVPTSIAVLSHRLRPASGERILADRAESDDLCQDERFEGVVDPSGFARFILAFSIFLLGSVDGGGLRPSGDGIATDPDRL